MGADNHMTVTPSNAEQPANNADIIGEHDPEISVEHRHGNLCIVRKDGDFVGYVWLEDIADLAE
jgi:predicted nuclease of predicted toxin-antitoxin system